MQIAAVMAVMALAAELFRMNDPWLLLPLSLCVDQYCGCISASRRWI